MVRVVVFTLGLCASIIVTVADTGRKWNSMQRSSTGISETDAEVEEYERETPHDPEHEQLLDFQRFFNLEIFPILKKIHFPIGSTLSKLKQILDALLGIRTIYLFRGIIVHGLRAFNDVLFQAKQHDFETTTQY
uniref:Uncharacterized protein n=1 Tax=Lygus hesperus TaxID=30085 RepID=A0A0K8SBM9_LYGHE